jgi:cell migration-inducing and hyaluronan-binding protein
MDLHMIEMDEGAWVIVEIPGFTNAASGTSVNSLDALRNADVTSYYKASDALWVKLVSPGDSGRGGHSGGVAVQVSR